ncbi:MAG: hypothetical protein ACI9OE_002257 [Mariniflexile sp.]|jgi:hypothetical protein
MSDKFDQNKTTSKTVSQTKTSTVINDDGVILSTQSDKIFKFVKDSEPSYIKFYLQDTAKFNDLSKGAFKLLRELFKYIGYNHNRIYLNSTIRQSIADELNIKEQTLNNGLNELKNHQLLIHLDKNVYMGNTLYFGKGEWAKLKKHRKNIGIEVKKLIVNGEITEVTNFNFDKCTNEKISVDEIPPYHSTRINKPLTKKQKTKLQKFLSIFKRDK